MSPLCEVRVICEHLVFPAAVSILTFGDVKFVFFSNLNLVCKIRVLFKLRLGPESRRGRS